MADILMDLLPLPQRLALSYVSGGPHEAALALFALDARLAQAIRQQREPALAQIRVAWWRDLLAGTPSERAAADPLIARLAIWQGEEAALTALVDGWEHLIAQEVLSAEAIATFAGGRATAFLGLRRLLGVEGSEEAVALAGTRWALADLATGLSDPAERNEALVQARGLGRRRAALPRALRPLAVLDGLARGVVARPDRPMLAGPGSLMRAFRIGMFGR